MVTTKMSFDPRDTTYFLGQVTLLITETDGMGLWRKPLFHIMACNARSAALFFNIPPEQTSETGAQVQL